MSKILFLADLHGNMPATLALEKEIEKITGRKADRRRKLYNGRIETQYYQYYGQKPVKGTQSGR